MLTQTDSLWRFSFLQATHSLRIALFYTIESLTLRGISFLSHKKALKRKTFQSFWFYVRQPIRKQTFSTFFYTKFYLLSSRLSLSVLESHQIMCISTRGLYRRSGITPCPEDYYLILYIWIVFTIPLYVMIVNTFLKFISYIYTFYIFIPMPLIDKFIQNAVQ